jgi:hypothetical protein
MRGHWWTIVAACFLPRQILFYLLTRAIFQAIAREVHARGAMWYVSRTPTHWLVAWLAEFAKRTGYGSADLDTSREQQLTRTRVPCCTVATSKYGEMVRCIHSSILLSISNKHGTRAAVWHVRYWSTSSLLGVVVSCGGWRSVLSRWLAGGFGWLRWLAGGCSLLHSC